MGTSHVYFAGTRFRHRLVSNSKPTSSVFSICSLGLQTGAESAQNVSVCGSATRLGYQQGQSFLARFLLQHPPTYCQTVISQVDFVSRVLHQNSPLDSFGVFCSALSSTEYSTWSLIGWDSILCRHPSKSLSPLWSLFGPFVLFLV